MNINLDSIPPLLRPFLQNQLNSAQQDASYTQPSFNPSVGNQASGNVKSFGAGTYEIESKSDIEYIEPDTSGQKQIFICEKENKIYVGRYNHARKEMDYKSFVDEGDANLFPKTDNSVAMEKISEALVLLAKKLDTIESNQSDLKENQEEFREELYTLKRKPEPVERSSTGQFTSKKKSKPKTKLVEVEIPEEEDDTDD